MTVQLQCFPTTQVQLSTCPLKHCPSDYFNHSFVNVYLLWFTVLLLSDSTGRVVPYAEKAKNRQDHTFQHQYNEKPSVVLGCPKGWGASHVIRV